MIAFLVSILSGILSGVVSSIMVTKYARFSEFRREALRIVRKIKYVPGANDQVIDVQLPEDFPALTVVASDLLGLGHRAAGTNLLRIFQRIPEAGRNAKQGKMGLEEFEHEFLSWQKSIREMRPSWAIYAPWQGL